MTGKHVEDKIKKCPLCGGEMHDGFTTVPFLIKAKVAIIRDVPAEICSNCGEAYMKSNVVAQVESTLDRVEKLHAEMSIIQYVKT